MLTAMGLFPLHKDTCQAHVCIVPIPLDGSFVRAAKHQHSY